MKTMFLIMGESGSGKDSVVNKLCERYGYKAIKSYTTRPKRSEKEDTHIFISEEEMEQYKDDTVAYTYFNDNHYFCTKEQLYNNDLYIIDWDGIKYLKEKVEDMKFITIYINVPEQERIRRMYERGHTQDEVISRINNDREKFAGKEFDYAVKNDILKDCVDIINGIIFIESKYI